MSYFISSFPWTTVHEREEAGHLALRIVEDHGVKVQPKRVANPCTGWF